MNFITEWKDKIAHYIDVRLQLAKLTVVEKTSGVLSFLVFIFISLFISLAVLVFAGMALGEMFSDLTGSRPLGYLITTGIYILLLLLLFALRKSIVNSFSGVFIRMLTHEEDEEEEQNKKEQKTV